MKFNLGVAFLTSADTDAPCDSCLTQHWSPFNTMCAPTTAGPIQATSTAPSVYEKGAINTLPERFWDGRLTNGDAHWNTSLSDS